MPQLGLPRIVGTYTNQLTVRLFIASGNVNSDLQFVKASVSRAREILAPYNIGLAVIPAGGMSDKEDIGVFSHNGPLFVDAADAYGRDGTSAPGAMTARTEVGRLISQVPRPPVIVLFGNSTSTRARGYTVENSGYDSFCAISLAGSQSKVTMLHEIGHCANLQHYMACRDITDRTTQDDRDVMAEVTDAKADLRDKFSGMELGLLRGASFMSQLD
ncbi:hypothetical protein [Plastoroseomonas arctica]|uniref:Uncharacterized protein n=1 Tax=Plastoroseomonas arctica TaxID=1509237 RepID=A0AAF1JVN6_9PROT|nr:hypothetical protein [Plastoroseomonas arctica]MBR0654715.1 hypothetical protein [Plastoroseomonas arctica]